MSVTITRNSERKRIYRVVRRINGEQVIKDFPCTREGYEKAQEYDKKLYEKLVEIRNEKTNSLINDDKIKGFNFYANISDDLSRVIAKFNINKKYKNEQFIFNRTVKRGETLEQVFDEMKLLYCNTFDIDVNNSEIIDLFNKQLKKFDKTLKDVHDLMFYQREERGI